MFNQDTHYELVQKNIILQSVSATSLIVVSEQPEPHYTRPLQRSPKRLKLNETLSPHEILRPCRVGVTCTHRLRTMHILRRYWQANTIQNVSSYLYKNTNVWMIVFTWFRMIHYNGEMFTITLQVRGNKCRTFHCIKVTNVYVTWLGEAPWKNNTVSERRTTQKACALRIGRLHTRNILWFQWGTWKITDKKEKLPCDQNLNLKCNTICCKLVWLCFWKYFGK